MASSKRDAALMINASLERYAVPVEVAEFAGPWYATAPQLALLKLARTRANGLVWWMPPRLLQSFQQPARRVVSSSLRTSPSWPGISVAACIASSTIVGRSAQPLLLWSACIRKHCASNLWTCAPACQYRWTANYLASG